MEVYTARRRGRCGNQGQVGEVSLPDPGHMKESAPLDVQFDEEWRSPSSINIYDVKIVKYHFIVPNCELFLCTFCEKKRIFNST